MNARPWRTVLPEEETGRFTREQLDQAVLTVTGRRERFAAAGRPMMVREEGPVYGYPSTFKPLTPKGLPENPARYPAPPRRGGRKRSEGTADE